MSPRHWRRELRFRACGATVKSAGQAAAAHLSVRLVQPRPPHAAARVRPFADRVGLAWVPLACKPLPVGLAVARRRLGVRKNQMAMVGDQIFTDRLAAGLYGISCLYTMPRGGDHQRGVQFKRRFEPYWLDRYYQKGGRLYE